MVVSGVEPRCSLLRAPKFRKERSSYPRSGFTLIMFFLTSARFYQTARRHIPEDTNRQSRPRVPLPSSLFEMVGTYNFQIRKLLKAPTVFLRRVATERGNTSFENVKMCRYSPTVTYFKDLEIDGWIILKRIVKMWGMDWIALAEDRGTWRALVNAVMYLRVP